MANSVCGGFEFDTVRNGNLIMHLTVKQAADRLGVNPSLVYRLIAARQIEYERIGLGRGVIRIRESAIEDYLARVRSEVMVEPMPMGVRAPTLDGNKLKNLSLKE